MLCNPSMVNQLYNGGMKQRVDPGMAFESQYWQSGMLRVAGIDEAGRGCWAGPVTAGAVILPAALDGIERMKGVRDSKQLSATQREALLPVVKQTAICWSVGWASNVEIDAFGIVPATRLAMRRAIASLSPFPQALLIDAVRLPEVELPQQSMNYGDSLCLSIAAASICAKVYRDRWMVQAEKRFPGYGFLQHKGYGTRQHRQALDDFGPCAIHRFSFRPLEEPR